MKKSLAIVFLVLLADQILKVYIKTHYTLGEMHPMLGNWSYILFIENEGMAFGWKFLGTHGKLFLSIFRIIAAGGIFWYLHMLIAKGARQGMILSFSLIFAGAVGNIIDSAFYGVLFTESTMMSAARYSPGNGYAGFLHGHVVDMFYFPLIEGYYPDWNIIPAALRGDHFLFFRPVFNLADSSITVGVSILLIFQRRFFRHDFLEDTKNAEGSQEADTGTDSGEGSETMVPLPEENEAAADTMIEKSEPENDDGARS